MGALDEVDILVHILLYTKADDADSGSPEISEGGILIGRAELQRMNKVDATNDVLRMRRAPPIVKRPEECRKP